MLLNFSEHSQELVKLHHIGRFHYTLIIISKFNELHMFTIDVCDVGKYANTDTEVCDLCERGYYQPDKGQFFCYECEADTTTAATGSQNEEECYGMLCRFHTKVYNRFRTSKTSQVERNWF